MQLHLFVQIGIAILVARYLVQIVAPLSHHISLN